MARILTGIQSTGVPHLGNILGAIEPGISLAETPGNEAFFFIADLHSLTTIRDARVLRENTYSVAASWIACGFDIQRHYFYRQSDIPEVTELAWHLNCITPFPMLANAHSFKDKSEKLADVSAGLFTYPVLQAADIMIMAADKVPVGKDQIQHLEMTRDIGGAFNRIYGETLKLPDTYIREDSMYIPGTDGHKMSKSYGNTIVLFTDDKSLKKQVMSITTDSTPLESPKNPDTCHVFAIYKVVATAAQTEDLRQKYLSGNFGYGHAKQALLEVLMERFRTARETYTRLMADPSHLESLLLEGAARVRPIALDVLAAVREKVGLRRF